MDFLCGGMNEFNMLAVVDRFEFEDGLFGFHMPNADPDPGGYVAEYISIANDSDVMFSAKFVSQIQGSRMAGKSRADDNNFRHKVLLSHRTLCPKFVTSQRKKDRSKAFFRGACSGRID
jgi:hypothetical protein